jgi:hypothetical protein
MLCTAEITNNVCRGDFSAEERLVAAGQLTVNQRLLEHQEGGLGGGRGGKY